MQSWFVKINKKKVHIVLTRGERLINFDQSMFICLILPLLLNLRKDWVFNNIFSMLCFTIVFIVVKIFKFNYFFVLKSKDVILLSY